MYYPKSQIKTNQYTNGGEYILSTTKEEYKGDYYETSNGEKYTGKTPQDNLNILLTPIIQTINLPTNDINPTPAIIVNNIIEDQYNPTTTPVSRNIPPINITLPTAQEQSLGIFTRYFCKKTNENIYLEINKETYTQLKSKDPKIAWDLYEPQSLLWQIKGNKEQTYTTNKNMAKLIEQNQKWYGFTQYFKEDFLKYYLGS
jgi:hypothetical protein